MPHKKRSLTAQYISRHKGLLLGTIGLGLFSKVLSIAIPLCIGKFYQLAFDGGGARSGIFNAIFGDIESISTFFILFFSILVIRFFIDWVAQYSIDSTGEKFSAWLRETLFEKQLKTDIHAFQKKTTGKYLLRYSGDMSAAQQVLTKATIGFLIDCGFVVMAIGMFLLLNVQLTWIVAASIPLIIAVSAIGQRAMLPYITKKRTLRSRSLSFVSERLNALSTIKILNRITPEKNKFDRYSEQLLEVGVQYQLRNALNKAIYPFLLYCMLALVMFGAYQQANSGDTSADGGTLIVFIMLTLQLIPTIKRILRAGAIRKSGTLSLQKIESMLQEPEEALSKDVVLKVNGNLQFDHVSYSYEGHTILNNWSADIQANSITCIHGKQGAGKSTITKLISALYTPDSGALLIDGQPYTQYSVFTLRKNIAVAASDMPLIGKTIFGAISYNKDTGKRGKALQVLQSLGFSIDDAFLDKPIREGGKNLSDGEQQLMRIARTLLTGKKIMVFDDPFLFLDQERTELVTSTLNAYAKKHTIIVLTSNYPEDLDVSSFIPLEQPKQPKYV